MRLNVAGWEWIEVDGYGRFCLKTAQALIRAGHDIYPFEIKTLDKPAWFCQAQGLRFDRATLQIMPPHNARELPGRSAILTMHESAFLPIGWGDHVNRKAQVLIVPHEWLVPVFEQGGVEIPIEVVKSGIDPEECAVIRPKHNGPYTFMCLGDRGSRKGWDLVWRAFYKVFDYGNKDVRLIVKARPSSLPNLDFSYGRDDRLTIWRQDVKSVADIFAPADAFVFPTRCEGWGQPCREAAGCGLPTVVTRYSGVDDETDKWAIPIDNYKMVESNMEGCGGLWAEPDFDELCEKMLWLYEHQDEAAQKGLQSARWMRANRTYAQSAHNLTVTLAKHFHGPIPEPEPEVPAWDEPIPEVFRRQPVEVPFRKNGHKETVTA